MKTNWIHKYFLNTISQNTAEATFFRTNVLLGPPSQNSYFKHNIAFIDIFILAKILALVSYNQTTLESRKLSIIQSGHDQDWNVSP